MHDHKIDLDAIPKTVATAAKQWRAGRPRVALWNRRRLGLLLAILIVPPWLPIPKPAPQRVPTRWARGTAQPPIIGFAYAPDGKTIATAHENNRVALWELTDGWTITRFLNDRGHEWTLAFSPDGRYLVAGGTEPDIVLCDLERSGQEHYLGIPVRQTSALRFSPDGRTLAVSSFRSTEIILWDIEARRKRMALQGHQTHVLSMAFAPDGRSQFGTPVSGRST